ncbi:single-stranded DNA-binding protein [Haliea salexigens]|uniref:single-stranded DNA-binding protein n=1 Tax=Haliea salexigens TaxID=287487 RepID=UPI0003F6CE1D|nr:single-stranded DNA-binding protein [Haliea salexigens]
MNVFNTIARLGKDAELKYMPSGDAVMQFTAAFDSGYGDKKVTTWLSCALFGKRASENLCQYLTKGTQVGLSGEIKLDEWRGQDGSTQKTLKMRVNDLTLLSSSEPKQQARQAAQPRTQPMPEQFDDENIPF